MSTRSSAGFGQQPNRATAEPEARSARGPDGSLVGAGPLTSPATEDRFFLDLIEETAHIGAWEWDLATGAVFWSRGLWRLLGIEPDERGPSAKRWHEHIHPDDRGRVNDEIARFIEQDSGFLQQFRLRRADGAYRWTSSRGQIIRDAGGRARRVVGISVDIDDQARSNRAILASESRARDSEARLEAIRKNAPLGIAECTLDGAFVRVNDAFCRITGYSLDELRQRTFRDITHPDDVAADEALYRETQTGQREHYQIIKRYIHKDGRVLWVNIHATVIRDSDGAPLFGVGLVEDVTARKHAEDQLRIMAAVVERSGDFIGIATPEMRPIFVNEAGRRMVGLDTDEEVRRTSVLDYFMPDDRARIEREAIPALARDGHWRGEVRFRHFKTGAAIDTMWNAVVIKDDSGRAVAWATVSPDLTAIKQATAALREADRRKDEFLAMLAHELRNPLAAITSAIQLSKLPSADDQTRRWAVDVEERQTRQLTRLIDDLLDVSRITTGKIQLKKEPLELSSIIDRAVEAVQPQIAKGRHTLTVSHVGEQRLWVEGDEARLQQIFVNLLGNAAKYMKDDGRIWLTIETVDQRAVVRVRDEGVGLSAEMLPKVFDLFAQADRSLDRSQGGLGIGLTLVKRLVEKHGGTVAAHSDGVGRGCEFTVALPLIAPPARESTQRERDGFARPLEVLIVDDNQDAGIMLSLLIRRLGHGTVVAHAAAEALEACRSSRFDVALLDIGLPEIDGYELARRLRAIEGRESCALVAISGYGQPEDRRRSLAAGFDDHLVKPVDLDRLAAIFNALSERPLES